jgi:hypothetical protein
MRWGSLILGLILMIPSVLVYAIGSDIRRNIPIIGQVLSDIFEITPLVILGIAILGFILVINGFRPVPTKLTVEDVQRLGLTGKQRERQVIVYEQMVHCKFCGSPIPLNAAFCDRCGKSQK